MPRLLVLSGNTATIHVGSREPYVTVDSRESQGVINYFERVTEVDVGVKLEIQPTVHPNGFITLRVSPEVSSVNRYVTTSAGSNVPVVEQSTMVTEVRVEDGAQVILGGLMRNDVRKVSRGVPILSRIPVIKYAFGSTVDTNLRTELVVMLRPTIVTGAEVDSTEAVGP